jgi:UDP:flavonoid glycosyltransferase YjiC (YdhE family)
MICLMPFCGYLSETSRMLEIHRALSQRGAQVRVATQGGAYESLLRKVGYDIVGPHMSPVRAAQLVRSAIGLGNVGQSMYSDAELLTYARAEADYFTAHNIRVVVTGFTLTTLLSTRLAGVKLVTEHAGCFVPPVFERRLVPGGWLANAVLPRRRFYTSGFNRVAAALNVPGVPSVSALVLGDLSLVPEAPEVVGISPAEMSSWRPSQQLDRPEARLRYAGPLYARLDQPIPRRVTEFLARPGPVVYVAITSTTARLVRAVVRALLDLDVRVLVAGTVHELADLAGPRVLVEGVLPSHRIMPEVDLAITAGGQGSVQTAMATGTPLLGLPLQLEQQLNVALVARLGAARTVAPRSAARVARVAAEMLADDRYRRSAKQVQQIYDGIDGPGAAADAIIELCAS